MNQLSSNWKQGLQFGFIFLYMKKPLTEIPKEKHCACGSTTMSHPSVVGDTMLMEKLWRPHADGHFFLVVPFLTVMSKIKCTKYALTLLSSTAILYTKVRGEGKFHLPLKNVVFT